MLSKIQGQLVEWSTLADGLGCCGQQFHHVVFDEQRASEDTQDIKHTSFKVQVLFDDGHCAIGDYGSVYLYSDGILVVSPEMLDAEVLFYPLEKRLDLPAVFVEQGYLGRREGEVVGVIGKSPAKFGCKVDNSTNRGRIFLKIALTGESNCLIPQHSSSPFKYVLTLDNVVWSSAFFTNNKEGILLLYPKHPCQIKIAFVEDVASQRFYLNVVKSFNIVHRCVCNEKVCRNLSGNVELGLNLYPGFGLAKCRPFKESHAEVYRCRVKGIVLAWNNKLFPHTFTLRKFHHIVSEPLKDAIIALCIGPRKRSEAESIAKTESIGLLGMSLDNRHKFAHGVTPIKLTKNQKQKVIPVTESPVSGFVLYCTRNHSSKLTLWNKVHDLTEYVFPFIHLSEILSINANILNSNRGQLFQASISCNLAA